MRAMFAPVVEYLSFSMCVISLLVAISAQSRDDYLFIYIHIIIIPGQTDKDYSDYH